MGKAKTLNNVVINMTLKPTQTRAKLSTSSEDLAVQMGKINKWYDSLVPTGGASGNILEWDSDGVAKWVTPSFLDEKVKSTLLAQSTAEGSYRPTFVTGAGTGGVNIIDSFKVNHSPGTTSVVGNTRLILGNATASGTANNEEGQLKLYSSGTSFHTLKGTTVSSEVIHVLPSTGGTVLNTGTTTYTQTVASSVTGAYEIGKIKINGTTTTIYGKDTNTTYTASDGIKIESNVIKHTNSITTAASVFKKISYDAQGHITATTNVTAADLPAHTHDQLTVTVNNGSTTLTNYAITFVANPNTTEADSFYKTNDARFQVVNGTTSSGGTIGLILGNTKNATTADNKRGLIYLYDSGAYYAQISTNSLTNNQAITLPNDSGTVALTKNIPTIAASSNNGYLSVNSTDILVYSTGLAHTKFNQAVENVTTDAWATVGVDPTGRGYILKSLRFNTNYPVWAYAHCAGIVFGGQDTKGMINMSYSSPAITFAGGNHSDSKTAPVWYMKITGTAGATYNLANFVTTDTKNTAGSTDTSSKIYLIGATTQAANPQTYSDNEVYTTSGVLTTKKVQVGGGNCTMEYNSTTQSLDFVFAS